MKNKRLLIFGGSGSLGIALIKRLIDKNKLSIFSRDESKHWKIKNKIKSSNISFAIGDIRDYCRVKEVIVKEKPDIIIIASALKYVDVCELTPQESILTNINGPQNVVNAVVNKIDILPNLETVLMVSTDKACEPINVYGMCKALAERLTVDNYRYFQTPKFLVTRYGNVLQSRGSIIPLFMYQAQNPEEKYFTLTREDMTRFLMTLDDSVKLILDAIEKGESGETWIPRLKSMRVKDLVELFSEIYKKPIKIIGIRPGEKIHESLINQTESIRTVNTGKQYIIKPIHENKIYNVELYNYNSSQNIMDKNSLFTYLDSLNIFKDDVSKIVERMDEEY